MLGAVLTCGPVDHGGGKGLACLQLHMTLDEHISPACHKQLVSTLRTANSDYKLLPKVAESCASAIQTTCPPDKQEPGDGKVLNCLLRAEMVPLAPRRLWAQCPPRLAALLPSPLCTRSQTPLPSPFLHQPPSPSAPATPAPAPKLCSLPKLCPKLRVPRLPPSNPPFSLRRISG